MRCFISGEECLNHRMKIDPTSVFVISPFGYPFDDIYERGIEPFVGDICCEEIGIELSKQPNRGKKVKLKVGRADQAFQIGFVMCQRVCRKIQNAGFIIADVTGANPNVFYELGLSYAMKKRIILIGGKGSDIEPILRLFNKDASYIPYSSLDDFYRKKKDMFIEAFKNPIVNSYEMEDLPKAEILNIIDQEHSIGGLSHRVIRDSIEALKNGKNFEDTKVFYKRKNGNRRGTTSNRPDEEKSISKLKNNWKVATPSISFESTIDIMIDKFKDCYICVVDSSLYGKNGRKNDRDLNPFLYFCLGMGHGFQKKVIPLTNTPTSSDILPFDVRGLWHIFFKDLDELQEQFMEVMPEIDRQWSEEKKKYYHRKIWGPILEEGDLHIITCARDAIDERRPNRAAIDKWDYDSVGELSMFISKNYPNVTGTIPPPKSERSVKGERAFNGGKGKINEEKAEVVKELSDKNCIIIGSPEVSDYSEILLAELFDIVPYLEKRQRFNGYAIIKDTPKAAKSPSGTGSPQTVNSSFYWEKSGEEKEGVCILESPNGEKYKYYQNSKENGDDTQKIYGILTIADNPFVSAGNKRKIMILSGFSGIATYALAKLLTSEEKTYADELEKLYMSYSPYKKNVQILIGTKFKTDSNIKGEGDKRTLVGISFEEIKPIEKSPISKTLNRMSRNQKGQ